MTFANLPLLAVLAGLAALAALLFALQWLRTRHVEVVVPTTLFWLAAARDAPVRVFWRRFRHWLAYLLILLICALLWLALAVPEVPSRRAVDFHVLFLDGSAHSARPGDLERAVAALKEDLEMLPADRREVIWGGAFNLKLLRAGEDALLLDQRLGTREAAPAPSALEDQLRLLNIPGAWPERLELVIYGRAPVAAKTLAALRDGIRVSRGVAYPAAAIGPGIVAFGLAPATSAHPERVDALLAVAAPDRDPALNVTVRLDGAPVPARRVAPAPTGSRRALFAVRDVPAGGGVLEAQVVDESGLALDDVARTRLPLRRVLRVAVAPDLPAPIAGVVAADAGLTESSVAEADVVARRAGSDFGPDHPALEFVPAGAQSEAFRIDYTGEDADAQRTLRAHVSALGLDQIDATHLASALRRPLAVAVRPASRRRIVVWEDLLGEAYNFTASRSFPVFVSRALRYLAAEPMWHPYVAAGRPLPAPMGAGAWLGRPVAGLDGLGAALAPARAGAFGGEEGSWIAALLSEEVTAGHAGVALPTYSAPVAAAADDIALWLALVALALLAAEWALHQRGLIP